jgi:16S rRNA (guanine527-N7)-methyltransferase
MEVSALSDLPSLRQPEIAGRLEVYAALLRKWNPAINLVSSGTLGDAARRHFLDSAQLLDLAPAQAMTWADLGSGGGFPGMVVAILAATLRPALVVTLVEADQRKAEFLRTVSRETGVDVQICVQRIEVCPPLDSSVVSARALAPLAQLCEFGSRHMSENGVCLFMKGAHFEAEVEAARMSWDFHMDVIPSKADANARILVLRDLHRV